MSSMQVPSQSLSNLTVDISTNSELIQLTEQQKKVKHSLKFVTNMTTFPPNLYKFPTTCLQHQHIDCMEVKTHNRLQATEKCKH